MRVLLIDFNPFMGATTPISLGYLAAVMRADGHEAMVVGLGSDSLFSPAGLAARLRELSPDLVGFGTYQRNMLHVRAIARLVKDVLTDSRVILGGPQGLFLPDDTLMVMPDVDFLARGEGELALSAAVSAIESGAAGIQPIPGITSRLSSGDLVTGEVEPAPDDLDAYPSPWLAGILDPADWDEAIMLTSRGCPHHCLFCLTPAIFGDGVRCHSRERVLDEIEYVARRGSGRMWFADPNFCADAERVVALLEGVLHRGLDVRMWIEIRAEMATAEVLALMKRAGVDRVAMGLESASPAVYPGLLKGLDPERIGAAARAALAAGIDVELFSQYALPNETLNDALMTLRFVRDCGVAIRGNTNAQQMQLYHGSDITTRYREHGIKPLRDDLPPYLALGTEFETEWMSGRDRTGPDRVAGGVRGRRETDRVVTSRGLLEPADQPTRSVYLRHDADGDPSPVLDWLDRALPELSWHAHIFVLGNPEPSRELVDGVLGRAGEHLDRVRFGALAVHPQVDLDRGSWFENADFDRMLEPVKRFQEEGYREQGESRLLVHPILTTRGAVPARRVVEVVAHLRSRLAFPRLMIGGSPAPDLLRSLDRESIRIHVEPGGGRSADAVTGHLGAHHVFESLLDRTDDLPVLSPCNRHLVVDPERGGVFSCFYCWRERLGEVSLDGPIPGSESVPVSACAGCMARSMDRVHSDLEIGERRSEGHQVLMQLAVAIGERRCYDDSAGLAAQAADLATAGPQRAAARLHQGLSCLHAGRLEEADRVLCEAVEDGADPGLIAFHRGRVQMAWPDEIEALERFEEAETASSEQVPPDELHLLMAMCHVNLAEFSDARPHLDQVAERSQLSVVEFYRGLCELGEGRAENALELFRASLAARPAADDLSRMLLYLSTSLKELDRYEEAVEPLERAVALEPGESAHHNLLGYCFYKLGRHDEAVDCFKRAVEIDPRSALDWSNLGANLRELGHLDEAEVAYKKALTLDPTLTLATNGLARVGDLRRGGTPPPAH